MIFREHNFKLALGLTIGQQAFLALSTYFIAQAGASLIKDDINEVLLHISFFFVFALLAYITSSVATVLTTRASNIIWKNYNRDMLKLSVESMMHAVDKNKKTIAQWLGGEASSTISHACSFYIGIVSTSLNIILTLLVFFITLGWAITVVVALSLVISLVVIILLRDKIKIAAGNIQRRKLNSLLQIEFTWCLAIFGNKKMRQNGFDSLDSKSKEYFDEVNRYIVLEQVVACAPIVISTLSMIMLLQLTDLFTAAVVGALVAVLPRCLQIFGSVHSLSVYFSQFFLVRSKLKNLDAFPLTLDKHSLLYEIPLHGILIRDHAGAKNITASELMAGLKSGRINSGRFSISGNNGAGKSSFLRIIKSFTGDSILMTPETSFINFSQPLSTGQSRIKEINGVLLASPSLLMLDEWDANLDNENLEFIDKILHETSKRLVIIEVRHLRSFISRAPGGNL